MERKQTLNKVKPRMSFDFIDRNKITKPRLIILDEAGTWEDWKKAMCLLGFDREHLPLTNPEE